MCGTRALFVLSAKQSLKWKLSENVARIILLRGQVGVFFGKDRKIDYFGFMKSNEIYTFDKSKSISLP